MIKLLNLIHMENIKIYYRPRVWIMIGLIFICLISIALIKLNTYKSVINEDWKQELVIERNNLKKEASIAPIGVKKRLELKIKVNDYRIKHNIPPVSQDNAWKFAVDMSNIINISTFFTVIVASSIVASEFNLGTIKLLLIRPVKRWKILLAKYLATLIFALFMLSNLIFLSILIGGIFFGFNGLDVPHIIIDNNNNINEINIMLYIIFKYLSDAVSLIMTATLAFMISTVFKNGSLAIVISLLTMLVGNTFVQFLALFQFNWIKYLPFTHLNLLQYFEGSPIIEGMTLSFSLLLLVTYFFTFITISFIVFNRRDMAV